LHPSCSPVRVLTFFASWSPLLARLTSKLGILTAFEHSLLVDLDSD
jgi:hypothetical protein